MNLACLNRNVHPPEGTNITETLGHPDDLE